MYHIYIIIIIIIIGIQPLGRSGQRPEFSQATGMALVRCILVKFLGVACHCFPPLFRCSHFLPLGASTSATTREIPEVEVGTVGENVVRYFCRNDDFHTIHGSFTCRRSTTWDRRLYFPSEGGRAEDFFALKNPTASAGFEPANSGTRGQHAYL